MLNLKHNINYNIKCKIVKLINDESKFIGYYKFKDIIYQSKLKNLDLVEIAKVNNISVCKVIKYGKFIYLEKKKFKNKPKKIEYIKKKKIKEIKMTLFICNYDFINKIRNIKRLLNKTFNVKVLLVIRGKQIYKKQTIHKLCCDIIEELKDLSTLMKFPNINNKNIYMYFISNVKKIKK